MKRAKTLHRRIDDAADAYVRKVAKHFGPNLSHAMHCVIGLAFYRGYLAGYRAAQRAARKKGAKK